MNRPFSSLRPSGYTLVEILITTTLALLLLGAVVAMFGRVGEGITNSRSMLEAAERLRLAAARLQQDLAGVTVIMDPPRRPEDNEGYFEYIEGPVGTTTGMVLPSTVAVNSETNQPDLTVGDFDDILMFTTRSTGRPFIGRCGGLTIQSDVAEVAWFLRGRTLHRRVLLVVPNALPANTQVANYYRDYDISARPDGNDLVVANTLGDLTRRECRFAHPSTFPFDARLWGQLGLPTLSECSNTNYNLAAPPLSNVPSEKVKIDFWHNQTSRLSGEPAPWADDVLLPAGSRIVDDIILTNVIGFDVKAWDPEIGGYVDLGHPGTGRFSAAGRHPVAPNLVLNAYDTWSTHYETEGAPGLSGTPGRTPGQALNGLDDNSNGIVDDDTEKLTSPPYPYPLRGIQVKIRVFEPDSRQVREVTVVQDFLPR